MIPNHLPHGLQVIADAAGVDAALKIALKRGGSRLSIPQKAEGSLLAEIVGIDAAQKIVDDLANQRIDIPLAKRNVSDWLRDHHGMSQEKRAMALGAARRTIQLWDKGSTPTLQQSLFDLSA